MSDDITEAIAEGLDAVREELWPGVNELEILKRSNDPAPASPYRSVESIFEGWCPELVTDPTTGPGFFNFEIAETDTDFSDLFDDSVSFLKMGEDAYEFQGVEKPQGIPRVWVVKCSPTAVGVNSGSALISQGGAFLLTQAGGRLRAHG